MILLDFSGIAMAAMFSQKSNDVNEDLIRHQILNVIRMYNLKHRAQFGEMVITCDGGSWRKNVFAEYKAARKINREASKIDWDAVWDVINKVREEIAEHLPYKVVQVKGAEADDIIAILTETTQEFGCSEKVMIISADKDFIQLQKFGNVSQFSPMTKKLVTDKNPRKYLIEHILRGDSGDGVPNVLSPDNVFLTDARQTPVTKAKVEFWTQNFSNIEDHMDDATYRNFVRNRRVIDLSYIPDEVRTEILDEFNAQPTVHNSKVMSYLISKRCKMLINCTADFFPPKQ
jgi:hypothetical protein